MKKNDNVYIDVKDASKETGIPMTRIINKILVGDLNGIVVDGRTAFIQKSELKYVK